MKFYNPFFTLSLEGVRIIKVNQHDVMSNNMAGGVHIVPIKLIRFLLMLQYTAVKCVTFKFKSEPGKIIGELEIYFH